MANAALNLKKKYDDKEDDIEHFDDLAETNEQIEEEELAEESKIRLEPRSPTSIEP